MQVLFLALGASRKRAVTEESAEITASGGRAVVIVDRPKAWSSVVFAPGVDVVTPGDLDAAHLPRRIERLLLYRLPRAAVSAAGVVRPVRKPSQRVLKAYERRVAGRVHRRVFLPLHRRLWPTSQARAVRRRFGAGGPELLVVADALSVSFAVQLLDVWGRDGAPLPRIAYSIDGDRPARIPPVSQAVSP